MALVQAAVNLARVMVAVAAKSLSPPMLTSVALRAGVFNAAVLTTAALRAMVYAAVMMTPWMLLRLRRKNFTHFAPDIEDTRFGCTDTSFDG